MKNFTLTLMVLFAGTLVQAGIVIEPNSSERTIENTAFESLSDKTSIALESSVGESFAMEAGDTQTNGGQLSGGPFAFTVGDGVADMIAPGSITLSNAEGPSSQWVVTDEAGIILGLPPMPSVVDFDGAGAGTCLIWHLSYEAPITGLEVGQPASGLQGCHSLSSNNISVERTVVGDCQTNGGELFGGPFAFTVGDGTPDMIPAGSITIANAQGTNSQWVVTDDEGYILGLPPMPSVVDFDGAGAGTCLIWYLTYEDGLTGAEVGNNALTDLEGCFSLSVNSILVERTVVGDCQTNGGELFGGPFAFTVGDGTPDMIPAGSITIANAQGTNSQWVVTDDEGYILGLPPMPSVVDFDGAGAGTCLIWYLTYEDGLTGAEVGNNALTDLEGCFSLSANSISVERTVVGDCQTNGGELFGGPFAFCVDDGTPDMIPAGSITIANAQGTNSQWVVTFEDGSIAGLPPMPSDVNFDGAGEGVCQIWYLTYEDGLSGLAMGNQIGDLQGCFDLSNPIDVTRELCETDCTTETFNSAQSGWQETGLVWNPGDQIAVQPLTTDQSVVPVSGADAGETIEGVYIQGRFFVGLDFHFHGDFSGPGYTANDNWGDWGTYISTLPSSNTIDLFNLTGSGDETVVAYRWIGFLDANGDGLYESGVDHYLGDLDQSGFGLPETASGRLYIAFADRPNQYEDNLGNLHFTYCSGIENMESIASADRFEKNGDETITEEEVQNLIATNGQSKNDLEVSIFPNPTTGAIRLDANSEIDRIEIYNLEGRIIDSRSLLNTITTELSLDHLESGIYLIQSISADGRSTSDRLVITK